MTLKVKKARVAWRFIIVNVTEHGTLLSMLQAYTHCSDTSLRGCKGAFVNHGVSIFTTVLGNDTSQRKKSIERRRPSSGL